MNDSQTRQIGYAFALPRLVALVADACELHAP